MAGVVAALFVDPNGVYADLPDVEVWDEARDALTYAGPWPVVAHPPCARWSVMAPFVEAVHGYKRGDDGGTFESALSSVRRWGGVLEHPAYSNAWDHFGLPEPQTIEGWTGGFCGGWSAYVEQGKYGAPLRKGTWLYAYGLDPPPLLWGKSQSDEWPAGWRMNSDYLRNGRRRINDDGEAARTPHSFRDVLLAAARLVPARLELSH